MEDLSMSLMDQARLYQRNARPCEVVSAFKVDEGYSEDNRSQDDADSPTNFELMATDPNMPARMLAGLPEGIMALSEAERSGKLHCWLESWLMESLRSGYD